MLLPSDTTLINILPGSVNLSEAPAQDPDTIFGKPDEESKGCAQPLTLIDIVQRAMATKKESFDLGDAGGQGDRACLLRAKTLLTPMRQFIRMIRCEESILSQASIEGGVPAGNDWNRREHLLAVARRNAQLSRIRVSRFQMWADAQKKLSAELTEIVGGKEGLVPVDTYRPCVSEALPQVLAVRDVSGNPCVALTLCVYRGAVLRSPAKPSQRIRTSKPMPGNLPAAATKLIHALKMHEENGEHIASCTGQVLLLQPSESHVFGELRAEEVKPTAIRIHLRLSKASSDAMRVLASGKHPLPILPSENNASDAAAVDVEEEQELTRAAAAEPRVLFNDRSFMRGTHEQNLDKFFEGLRREYESYGHAFVDSNEMVMLKRPTPWASLRLRIPSYFLKMCGDLKGYKFSKAITLLAFLLLGSCPRCHYLLGSSPPQVALLKEGPSNHVFHSDGRPYMGI